MSHTQVTDAVGFFVLITAMLFGPAAADVVGPYVLIVAASVIGASFSLARRPPSGRWGAFWFFLRVVGLAILLTVVLSAWLASRYPSLSERSLLAPVALLIGFGDWPKLLATGVRALMSAIFKTLDGLRDRGEGDQK